MSNTDILNNKLQLLGKLSASLVHEIRNPLFALKLNLDYLSTMRSQVSDDAAESIQSCSEATDRMMFLIQNFSDFSKKHNLETELCSINDVTQIAVNIMQSNACRINMYIETELEPNLPSIYFQKDKLLQVFLNLITNAIEAENTRNTIFVRSYMDDNDDSKFIYWEVEDNGIGIKDEHKEKIFEDFYTSKKQGTGLGLSVCKKLLNEFDADVDFKSTYGQGSKFFIKFNLNSKQL
ncbi:MAG: HAMP domain-containing histidine kinase [Ignavibacteriales bacterium]|nr:HAMP domain-containing histidine kinase [Ignavibacteriales bacterium]MBP9119971.1 HAMP domain-containing histidine kinase [Ignavibacterium sp.]